MTQPAESRPINVGANRVLRTTPVYESYWRFAAERQALFHRRVAGERPPWTQDPIIAAHRFTNAYRASDRVSQYLIRNVVYDGPQVGSELFFRLLLFKLFNRVETWELLCDRLNGVPSWRSFDEERYGKVLDDAMNAGTRLYSAAYIMPSPAFGNARKHRNHLRLLNAMMKDGAPTRVEAARSLEEVYRILLSYPSLGPFLAFQYAIDLNYSELVDFSEMDFVVAGPGAKNGIHKCFVDTACLTEAEVIKCVAERADDEFARLGLRFDRLGGRRSLQLIDCQNLFCETDKYARVAHPEFSGASGRTRIKQKFEPSCAALPQFYPPKWGINEGFAAHRPPQQSRLTPTAQLSIFESGDGMRTSIA